MIKHKVGIANYEHYNMWVDRLRERGIRVVEPVRSFDLGDAKTPSRVDGGVFRGEPTYAGAYLNDMIEAIGDVRVAFGLPRDMEQTCDGEAVAPYEPGKAYQVGARVSVPGVYPSHPGARYMSYTDEPMIARSAAEGDTARIEWLTEDPRRLNRVYIELMNYQRDRANPRNGTVAAHRGNLRAIIDDLAEEERSDSVGETPTTRRGEHRPETWTCDVCNWYVCANAVHSCPGRPEQRASEAEPNLYGTSIVGGVNFGGDAPRPNEAKPYAQQSAEWRAGYDEAEAVYHTKQADLRRQLREARSETPVRDDHAHAAGWDEALDKCLTICRAEAGYWRDRDHSGTTAAENIAGWIEKLRTTPTGSKERTATGAHCGQKVTVDGACGGTHETCECECSSCTCARHDVYDAADAARAQRPSEASKPDVIVRRRISWQCSSPTCDWAEEEYEERWPSDPCPYCGAPTVSNE